MLPPLIARDGRRTIQASEGPQPLTLPFTVAAPQPPAIGATPPSLLLLTVHLRNPRHAPRNPRRPVRTGHHTARTKCVDPRNDTPAARRARSQAWNRSWHGWHTKRKSRSRSRPPPARE